ncbi:MAG: riboflavin deaminase [Cyanobacteria bacterium J083]|nr:MAG: riboflavin deaminase [Cyanobacteria bacterium J083]
MKIVTKVILAMTADGKIADRLGSAARFGSKNDKKHLEAQIATVDAVLLGANTLRAYGTSLAVANPKLLKQRRDLGLSRQPIQIVVSASAEITNNLRFFQQPFPRWLLTTQRAIKAETLAGFDKILLAQQKVNSQQIDWLRVFQNFSQLGIKQLAILGGGELVASLLAEDLINEIWLTICPVIYGGVDSPTPVGGAGFLATAAKKLELISVKTLEEEIFVHYRLSS